MLTPGVFQTKTVSACFSGLLRREWHQSFALGWLLSQRQVLLPSFRMCYEKGLFMIVLFSVIIIRDSGERNGWQEWLSGISSIHWDVHSQLFWKVRFLRLKVIILIQKDRYETFRYHRCCHFDHAGPNSNFSTSQLLKSEKKFSCTVNTGAPKWPAE